MLTTIQNDHMTVRIAPRGAELQSISCGGQEILWQGDPAVWEGRSPLLFPIVGRLKEDKLKYNGREYFLQKHGFGQILDYKLVENTGDKAVFLLESDENTKKSYPFDFALTVTYTLDGSVLTVAYQVKNTGAGEMYFSIGGHPAFSCKMGDKLVFEQAETAPRLMMNEDSYIWEKRPFLHDSREITVTETLFEEDALIFENLKSRQVTLQTEGYDVCVIYGDAPNLGIWAKPGAPYVCIEPWYGTDDTIDAVCTFDQKQGIVCLKEAEAFHYAFTIERKERSCTD